MNLLPWVSLQERPKSFPGGDSRWGERNVRPEWMEEDQSFKLTLSSALWIHVWVPRKNAREKWKNSVSEAYCSETNHATLSGLKINNEYLFYTLAHSMGKARWGQLISAPGSIGWHGWGKNDLLSKTVHSHGWKVRTGCRPGTSDPPHVLTGLPHSMVARFHEQENQWELHYFL